MRFGEKFEKVSFTDDGQVMETKGEKGLFGSEKESASFYTLEEYEVKLAEEKLEQQKEGDRQAMIKFGVTEDRELASAVEKSPNPEKGTKFKKALKSVTIGAIMLASTLGGFNTARAESNFVRQQSIVTNNDYENMSQQNSMVEKQKNYQYEVPRNYTEAFNILSEQELNDFKEQKRSLNRSIGFSDLKKFYVYTSKPSENTQYDTRQIVFKYGIDKVVNILKSTYLGIDKDGDERQIHNVDDFMKYRGMGLSRKGKFLKKQMYNLAEHLADDGQVFNDFVDKMRDLKYPKAIDPMTLAPEEMRFFLDNPNELAAYIKLETTVGAKQIAKLGANYDKDRNLQPKWSSPLPSEMLKMLESE